MAGFSFKINKPQQKKQIKGFQFPGAKKVKESDDKIAITEVGAPEEPKKLVIKTEDDYIKQSLIDGTDITNSKVIAGSSTIGKETTTDEYEEVPVEDFGAALLRGMGWEETTEPVYKEPKRREEMQGLGATHSVSTKTYVPLKRVPK